MNKSKKKKSQTPAQSPVRKSARSSLPADVENTPEATGDPGQGVEAGGHVALQPNRRHELNDRKELWMRDHGEKLFDVFSEAAMVTTLKEGLCFDSEYYEDQKDPSQRKLVIETVRVRKEFVEVEKKLSDTVKTSKDMYINLIEDGKIKFA